MMLLPVRDTMDRFLMAASKLDSSWPAGDCEVVREAVMQWLPLECCQGKIKALEIMQKVLTTTRFTLEAALEEHHCPSTVLKQELLKYDWPLVRMPPSPTSSGVAPVQRPCYCIQGFLDKFRRQYSYTASRRPAQELLKYMVSAVKILENDVFSVNEEMQNLSLSTKNALMDGTLLLQGALALDDSQQD